MESLKSCCRTGMLRSGAPAIGTPAAGMAGGHASALKFPAAVAAVLVGLSACGGGSSGSDMTTTPGGTGNQWIAGVFQPSAHFAAQCQIPRSGDDPSTGK